MKCCCSFFSRVKDLNFSKKQHIWLSEGNWTALCENPFFSSWTVFSILQHDISEVKYETFQFYWTSHSHVTYQSCFRLQDHQLFSLWHGKYKIWKARKQIIMDPVTGGLILLAYSTQFLKKDKMVLFSLNSLIHCKLGIPLCLVQQFQKCWNILHTAVFPLAQTPTSAKANTGLSL